MGSEQVAQVLRQCGNRVKLVIARGPVEEPAPSAVLSSTPVNPFLIDKQVMTEKMTLGSDTAKKEKTSGDSLWNTFFQLPFFNVLFSVHRHKSILQSYVLKIPQECQYEACALMTLCARCTNMQIVSNPLTSMCHLNGALTTAEQSVCCSTSCLFGGSPFGPAGL